MKHGYYKLPLNISRFFTEEGGHLDQYGELESIDRYLDLLLITCQGEHGFNQNFGTKIWDFDFENVVSKTAWEEKFVRYIRQAVEDNEKRLKDIDVQIHIRDVLREEAYMNSVTMHKRVDVVITGVVASTNKRHGFKYSLYMSPLSKE